MTPERWQEVKQALSDVLALPAAEREQYLRTLRLRNADVALEVETLLPHHAEADFLEQPAIALTALATGAAFGPYLIESALGEGGMGTVYLARDTTLERPVALKFLSRKLEAEEDARRRFLREAKAAAALDHPYICKIYQTGERDGRPFIAMEYVRGETLRQRLDAGPLSVADTVWIGLEVAEALETAHAAQIVHRDLKPSNIMLTADGHVKVLDFGLAKRIETEAEYSGTEAAISDTGTVQGTVAYMSPEQVRGESVDLRSDLFSIGVVLYECLTGRNPFVARSSLETASQILHLTPAAPSTARPEVAVALDRVVQRLLAEPVDQRYGSAADLRADLVRVRDGDDVPVTVDTPLPSPQPTVSRRTIIGSIAATAVLAIGGTWLWRARAGQEKSVAILPFIKGDDNAPDHFAIGIPMEVTRRLGNAGIRVVPWETAMRFHNGIDAVNIARTLGVTHVLLGSLQTAGDRLVINVSLVDGSSGFASWTQPLEFGLPDLFDLQTTIAQGIADKLDYELTGDAAAMLARSESSSAEAWDYYLQGARYLYEGGKEALAAAIIYFEKALALDRDLVAAHVGMGAVRLDSYWNGWGGGESNVALASSSMQEALKRDARDLRAWRGRMLIEFYRGNGVAALELGEQAARAGGPEIEMLLARGEGLTLNGPSDLARPLLDRVLTLDPANEAAAWGRFIALHQSLRWSEMKDRALEYRKQFGDDSWVTVMHANALTHLNELDGADALLQPLVDRLMAPSVHAATVTMYELVALLGGGALSARRERTVRALATWRRGLALTLEGLAGDPDSYVLKLLAVAFRGFLRDAAFPDDAERIMNDISTDGANPFALMYLGIAHAHRGDSATAVEVFRYGLKRGRLAGRGWWTVWTPELEQVPEFRELVADYESEADRRRRRYGTEAPPLWRRLRGSTGQ